MLNNEKAILRADFKLHAEDFFAAHSDSELEKIHLGIAEKLSAYCQTLSAKGVIPPQRVGIYEAMRFELPVRKIVLEVDFLKGAELVYPEYDKTEMWFLSADKRERVAPDFIIVPGLFVDKAGNRLGRGKGYYDGYLKNSPLPKERQVFLGYPFQFLEFVPTAPHDVRVAFISSGETSGR